MSDKKTYYAFCLTINNYTENDIYNFSREKFKKQCSYYIYAKEMGESGTPHLQCYCYYPNKKTIAQVSKQHPRAHIEIAKGTAAHNIAYCKKGNQPKDEWNELGVNGGQYGRGLDFVEVGQPPAQGARTDLIKIADEIKHGKKVDDIIQETPDLYHTYGRTMTKLEDVILRTNVRREMTAGIWYYGSTGKGKSHKAFENFSPSTHYVWKFDTDNMWNDGYTQQEIVILDDFRGQMRYNDLLKMVDCWPNFYVSRRGREPMPFTSKKVIVTSSLHPSQVYKNLDARDSLDQLYRRFELVDLDNI